MNNNIHFKCSFYIAAISEKRKTIDYTREPPKGCRKSYAINSVTSQVLHRVPYR